MEQLNLTYTMTDDGVETHRVSHAVTFTDCGTLTDVLMAVDNFIRGAGWIPNGIEPPSYG